jgi:outer membrane lipase/esterase
MSKFHSGVAAAALVLAMGAAGAASAQDYNRLVVFGDSLSDNGNLALAPPGPGGVQPPPAFYPTGRFSNGPTFAELLGFNTGRFMAGAPLSGSVNLAFGGAVSGRETRLGRPPGITDQLDAYLGSGGTFSAGDLVSVQGGANNIFQTFQGPPALPANPVPLLQGVAVAAASDITALTGRIAAAGAGTILVGNLPSLGGAPQFSPANVGAAASGVAELTTTTYNQALVQGLTAVAGGTNANIILMDVHKMSLVLNANPGAFGLSNTTTPCFNQVALTVCSNPDSYLYYDTVHPTAAGHRLFASLANDYLYYGDAGAQAAVIGETGYRHREDAMDAVSARMSGQAPWASGTSLSMSAGYDSSETGARGVVGAAEAETYNVRLALESGPSETMRFGFGAGISQGDVQAGAMSFDVESIGFDAWAGWRSAGGMFVNATAGVSADNYDDFLRQTALAPIVHTGKTDGVTRGARIQLGTWMGMGSLALSPRAAISWISSDVDGFTEQGAAAQYDYASRNVEAISGEVALRLEGALSPSFGFFAEAGYRDTLDDRSDDVVIGLANNPATPLGTAVEDPFASQGLLNLGIEGRMFERVQVSIGYRGRFGGDIDSHGGGIKFTLPLN